MKTIKAIKKGIRRVKKADTFAAKLVKWFFIVLVVVNVYTVIRTFLEVIK